jgi:hypothetical protein
MAVSIVLGHLLVHSPAGVPLPLHSCVSAVTQIIIAGLMSPLGTCPPPAYPAGIAKAANHGALRWSFTDRRRVAAPGLPPIHPLIMVRSGQVKSEAPDPISCYESAFGKSLAFLLASQRAQLIPGGKLPWFSAGGGHACVRYGLMIAVCSTDNEVPRRPDVRWWRAAHFEGGRQVAWSWRLQ